MLNPLLHKTKENTLQKSRRQGCGIDVFLMLPNKMN